MADRSAFIYLFPDRCIHLYPGEHSRMLWLMDGHFFISFWTGASICVQVSIPKCHGRWSCIFYLFLDGCIHLCPGEHSQMPWPMELHFLFISGQVHSFMSR